MIEILASIDAPDTPKRKGFVAGIVLWDDVVIEAAPIVQRMAKEHWHRNRVRSYCAERGWSEGWCGGRSGSTRMNSSASDRVRCCVPYCRRTREPNGHREWICGKHWPMVAAEARAAYAAERKQARRILSRKPIYGEYWRLPPGSSDRLAAVAMWRRLEAAWERCKRSAIESAAGL